MCMTSAVITDRINQWPYQWHEFPLSPQPDQALRLEFEQFREEMRNELLALKELLLAAKKFDDVTGQPDCEQAEKVEKLRQMAKLVGIDMDDVLASILNK